MKEFEKNWVEVSAKRDAGCTLPENWCKILNGNCAVCQNIRRQGWRAALEMVKREIFEHRDALDIIEEELEE